ncbi:P-loop containing nucleoside triphosphate hydrolase [Trichophyton rubrum]|nr:P-loop containing nucleoside triphosphate hydrolase [Trichophyton rubrum]
MLVGICGGICAGKKSVADFLVKNHGFQQISVAPGNHQTVVEEQFEQLSLTSSPNPSAQSFETIDELIDFVTPRWRELWVTTDIPDDAALERLLLRPFFLLISVDAPITLRWRRFTDRCWRKQLEPPDLEKFVLISDHSQYDPKIGISYLLDRAHVRLFNTSSSLNELHAALNSLDLLNMQRLRPAWDQYFMQLASLAAQRSNCMKRRVGCVIVKDNRVMSTGYNGTPRNMKNCNEGGCPRCNLGQAGGTVLSTCLCMHAEENALLEAGRQRIGEGSILYCDTCPCLTCSVKIAQLGISEVVYSQGYHMDNDSAAVLKEAGVKLRQFSPPCNRLIDLKGLDIKIPKSGH